MSTICRSEVAFVNEQEDSDTPSDTLSDVLSDAPSDCMLLCDVSDDEATETSLALKWTDTALAGFKSVYTGGSRANTFKKKASLMKAAQGKSS